MTSFEIASQLKASGTCVCPNYLDSLVLKIAQNDFSHSLAAGLFHRAGIGRAAKLSIEDSIRRDEIQWLDRNGTTQPELWTKFDDLKNALNRTLFLGIDEFEAHYAFYPTGGFYSRHRDSFADSFTSQSSRLVSIVIYLNSDWHESNGGCLRLYDGDKHTDIEPVGGTLVCFMSQDIEHEVLPSFAPRKSIAGWFRRKN